MMIMSITKRFVGGGIVLAATLTGCANSGTSTSPTMSLSDSASVAAPVPDRVSGGGQTPSVTEVVGACSVIQIRRAAIEWKQVSRSAINLFVPVNYNGPGNVWIHVWHPEVNNGQRLAIGPAGQTFRVNFPEPCRPYHLQLAVEVDQDGDKGADDGLQCDVHRLFVNLDCDNGAVCPACIP